jgi:NAD(P)-dependent dehydrogenase (short-subunit alcohol dehydrogenase family)
MGKRLDKKIALVSGGASGIGAAHARVFAAEGAKVLVCDVQEDMGRGVVECIERAGGEAAFYRLDVADEVNWRAAVAEAVRRFGGLTTLVNNAGVYQPAGLDSETGDGWNRIIAINQTGAWLGMKTAMPALLNSGNASIVMIGSIYGVVGSPGSFAYHASKGALRMMSKSAAVQYARQGVRVNSIFPHLIKTAIVDGLPPEVMQALEDAIPMGRGGVSEDIAHASVYLCSDEAQYVTGAELVIDGGFTSI